MKILTRIFSLAIVVAFTATTASAQFYLGPRAGMNLSNMSHNTAGAENLSIIGFHGGATAKYQFMQRLSVQMDGMVSTMGNNMKVTTLENGVTTVQETETNSMYVHVPVYVNYEHKFQPDRLVPYRMKDSYMSFHLYGGGFFGYGLSSSQGTKVTITDETGTTVTPAVSGTLASDVWNPIDFGIMAGAGLSFKIDEEDRNRLGFDARYLLGLGNWDKRSGYSASNSAIQASVFFTRKLTKRKYTTRHRR